MNLLQKRAVRTAEKDIWTTVGVVLTAVLTLFEFVSANAALFGFDITLISRIVLIVTGLKLVYDKYILPNFTEQDMADFAKSIPYEAMELSKISKQKSKPIVSIDIVRYWEENIK